MPELNARTLMLVQSITEVLQIYSEQEIGYSAEINLEKLEHYISSPATANTFWNANTMDDFKEIFTQEILNGEPVWLLLDIPKWTSDMLNREFAELLAEHDRKMKEKYKCLTCKYHSTVNTFLGDIHKCELVDKANREKYSKKKHILRPREPVGIQLKTRCKDYAKE